ncbi:uncharacterized protein [Lepeophtheirus salmonis]|uniref:uncharacterized protein isoform X4 n=1 Tax=Lepeophtheirus salmonis TaxID=72036 RepID=UPI003AF3AF6B
MLFSDAKEFILIPPEILVKIFCNLQFIDLLACTETCKKWNDLIKSRIFPKRSIHLTAYSNDQFTTLQKILDSTYRTFHGGITLKNLEKIPSLNFYEGITNLRLENLSSSILEDELIANVNRYDHIYSFSLQGSHVRLTTMGLSKLAVLEKLVYLNLSNYDLLHDEIFLLFLSRTPNLNSLILDNCCLNYAGDSGIKLKSDSIIQVCGYLPLKELSLNSSGLSIHNKGFPLIMKNLKSIKRMEILQEVKNESGIEYRERMLSRMSTIPLFQKCPYLDDQNEHKKERLIISIRGNARILLLRRIIIDLSPKNEDNFEILVMINSKILNPFLLPSSKGTILIIPIDDKDRYYRISGLKDLLVSHCRIKCIIIEGLGRNKLRNKDIYAVTINSIISNSEFTSIPIIYTTEESDLDNDNPRNTIRINTSFSDQDNLIYLNHHDTTKNCGFKEKISLKL